MFLALPIRAFGLMSSLFFFQAEDGIRDHCVTGVQTCALPICLGAVLGFLFAPEPGEASRGKLSSKLRGLRDLAAEKAGELRSEERRVGKECRSGWAP